MPDPARAAPAPPAGIADSALALADRLADGDLIHVAADEVRGAAIAAALQSAMPEAIVAFCPGSDALPGDSAPASPANVGQRVAALRAVRLATEADPRPRVALVTTAEATARLVPPPAAFDAAPPSVSPEQPIDLAAFAADLVDLGYIADERVDEPGEIAVRGQVIDVFPADRPSPVRIEAEAGKVAGIRPFDPVTQLSEGEIDRLELGRVSEPPLGKGALLLDHLPDACLSEEAAVAERRARFLALAEDAAARRPKRALKDIASADRWTKAAGMRRGVTIEARPAAPRFVEQKAPLSAFAKAVKAALADGARVVVTGAPRDLRFLRPRIERAAGTDARTIAGWPDAQPGLSLLAMPADRGFAGDGLLVIAAADLLGSRADRGDASAAPTGSGLFDQGDIRIGDVVVHEDHGLGVVEGLEALPAADGATDGEAIALRYADGGRRLVPVAEADRIWRYGADAEAVTLDRLDGASWQKRRGAIDAAIAESARALTELAAERGKRAAPVLDPDPAAYERFAAGFAFTETADQARAIAAVRADLAAGRPMDRLVIGDVGYGKTEVALRAAALAALAGKQVAIAAPTTVLARQHLESVAARFEGTGIAVAGLSRLSSAAERKKVKAGLADGSIGIVVGTGAVAGKGVVYKDLALVVIDEEQRFGAADKQRLRDLGGTHVLTLSATPIPRTLQTALVGLQHLSVIATPPARRQPIRTAVGAYDPQTLRTALLREQSRGGQSFVVVPRIEDMAKLAAELEKLVPELELLQAHGKMPAEAIDEAMVRFGRGDGDVLLATNIIEAGLDVPRANTMAIWRADRFGLSQLHQLRGRVGRGSRRGQVLLLTEPDAEIAPRTLQRLRTLQAFDRLGAGFAISARDLDMRGAGDLLGEAQAGHMKLIGTDLYQHLLEAALRAARGETVERWTPELHLGVTGSIPASWVPEAEVRVTLYTRLSRITEAAALDAYEAELEDRFGTLPAEAATLLAVARVRLLACAARIARIDAGPGAIAFTPRRDCTVDFADAGCTEKKGRWVLAERIEDPAERLARVAEALEGLA